MQAHCNFIEEMDSISDMNNLEKLRDLVQNEAYILAITAEKNKNLTKELKKQQTMVN